MPTIADETRKGKFNNRISEQRLDYAKFLLAQTTTPLEIIAAGCGWKSKRAFTVIFRTEVGVTPAHYRNWHQCRRSVDFILI